MQYKQKKIGIAVFKSKDLNEIKYMYIMYGMVNSHFITGQLCVTIVKWVSMGTEIS